MIDKLDDTVEIGYNEILVLKEVPLDLPPVAGNNRFAAHFAAFAYQLAGKRLEHSKRIYQKRQRAFSQIRWHMVRI